MVYHPKMSREDPQMKIRLPADLKDQIEAASKQSGRSMNSEIVARLDESFQAPMRAEEQAFQEGFESASLRIEVERLREQLHAERMQKFEDRASADTVGKMLEKLPAELASQYGLHLYRAELDRVERDLESAREHFTPMWNRLQELIAAGGEPGSRERQSRATSKLQKRIYELEEQANLLKQTISGIHTYREVNGLPEVRNVERLVVGHEVRWEAGAKPKG